jgi:hypothetical protein
MAHQAHLGHPLLEVFTMNPDGMLFTIRKTIPYLMQLGVSEQQIQITMIENPRRFFSRRYAPALTRPIAWLFHAS